jgi:hypothetical protein
MPWARRLMRAATLEAAVGLASEQHWPVAPGEYLVPGRGRRRCSCARYGCPRPGEHPIDDWEQLASTDPATVRDWWWREPDAPIVLPTGRRFDVVEVPAAAGRQAVERLDGQGVGCGPVAVTYRGRFQFFVRPGAARELAGLLAMAGHTAQDLQLTCRGVGDYVLAPPSCAGGRRLSSWFRAAATPIAGDAELRALVRALAPVGAGRLRPAGEPRQAG